MTAASLAVASFAAAASAQITLNANPGPSNNGGATGYGFFLDLTPTSQNLVVTSLTTGNTAAANATFSIEVFVRSGTGLGGPVASGPGSSSAGWTSLGTVIGTQGAVSSGVSLPIDIPDINLPAGQTTGVALKFTGAGPRYYGTGTPAYSTYADANLTLVTGDSRTAPFTPTGSFFSSRALVGSVDYTVAGGPPLNDNCGSAVLLQPVTGGDTTLATNDGSSTCDATGNDVWYSYTASAAGGLLSLATCGSAIDTVLTVYSGACGSLTELLCNDDAGGSPCSGPASALSMLLAPSQQVLIRVSDKGVGGTYTMASSYISAPTGAPTLTAPANGVNVFGLPVNLQWTAVTFATSYDVDLDGNVTTGVSGTTLAVNPAAGLHTWTVRGANVLGNGPWATPFTFTIPGPPPSSQCYSPAGPGGLIPTNAPTGSGGGGAFPTTLPPFQLDAPLAVTVPPGATQIIDIKLNGFHHTFAGDLQITLEDPTGAGRNLFVRQGGGNDFGTPTLGYDYTIYETYGYSWTTTTTPITAGAYVQNFGTWPDGTNNIFNTPLSAIPVVSGTYTLHIYDWAGGDYGALASWEICFNTPSGPTAYCAPASPGTSHGCIPTIAGTANPNVAQSNTCVITVSGIEGQQSGIIFYGLNSWSATWCSSGGNSFLCVKAPFERTGVQNSGGTFGACDGTLSLDWNAFQNANPGVVLGNPFSVGNKAYVQGWFRDPPSCKTTFLSEALELTYFP